jgi:hypothetical protein
MQAMAWPAVGLRGVLAVEHQPVAVRGCDLARDHQRAGAGQAQNRPAGSGRFRHHAEHRARVGAHAVAAKRA